MEKDEDAMEYELTGQLEPSVNDDDEVSDAAAFPNEAVPQGSPKKSRSKMTDAELKTEIQRYAESRFGRLQEWAEYWQIALARVQEKADTDAAAALELARKKDVEKLRRRFNDSVEKAKKRQTVIRKTIKRLKDSATRKVYESNSKYSDVQFTTTLSDLEKVVIDTVAAFTAERARLETLVALGGTDEGEESVEEGDVARKEGETDAAYAKRRARVLAKRAQARAYRARKKAEKKAEAPAAPVSVPADTADTFVITMTNRIGNLLQRAATTTSSDAGLAIELETLRLDLENTRAIIFAPADLVVAAMQAGSGGLTSTVIDGHPNLPTETLPWLRVARALAVPGSTVRMCVSRLSDGLIRLINNGVDTAEIPLHDGWRALFGPMGNTVTVRAMRDKLEAVANSTKVELAEMSDEALPVVTIPAITQAEKDESSETTEPIVMPASSDDEGSASDDEPPAPAPVTSSRLKRAGVPIIQRRQPDSPSEIDIYGDDDDEEEEKKKKERQSEASEPGSPIIIDTAFSRLAHAASLNAYPEDSYAPGTNVTSVSKMREHVASIVRNFHALNALIECVGHAINARLWMDEHGLTSFDAASAALDDALLEALYEDPVPEVGAEERARHGSVLYDTDLNDIIQRAWGSNLATPRPGQVPRAPVFVAPSVIWHWRGMPKKDVLRMLQAIRTGTPSVDEAKRAERDEALVTATDAPAATPVPLRHIGLSCEKLRCPPVWFDVAYAAPAIAESMGLTGLAMRTFGRRESWGFVWPPSPAALFRRDRNTSLHIVDAPWTLIPAPWQDVKLEPKSAQPNLVLRNLREIHLDAIRSLATPTSLTLAVYRLAELHIERPLAHAATAPLDAWQTFSIDFLRPLDAKLDATGTEHALAIQVHAREDDPATAEIVPALNVAVQSMIGGAVDAKQGAYTRISVERVVPRSLLFSQKPARAKKAKRSACDTMLHGLNDAITSAGDIVTGVIVDVPSFGRERSLIDLLEAARSTKSEARHTEYIASLTLLDAFYTEEFVERLTTFVRDHRVWLPFSKRTMPKPEQLDELYDDTVAQLVELGNGTATRPALVKWLKSLSLSPLYDRALPEKEDAIFTAVKWYRIVDSVRAALTSTESFVLPEQREKSCLFITHGIVPVTRMGTELMPMTRTLDGEAAEIVCVLEAHSHVWAVKVTGLPDGLVEREKVEQVFGDFMGLWWFLPALEYHTEPSELASRASVVYHGEEEVITEDEPGQRKKTTKVAVRSIEEDVTNSLSQRTRGERFCVLPRLVADYLNKANAAIEVKHVGGRTTVYYTDRLLSSPLPVFHVDHIGEALVSIRVPTSTVFALLGAAVMRASSALSAMGQVRRTSVPNEAYDVAAVGGQLGESGVHPTALRLEDDPSLYAWAGALAKCRRLADISANYVYTPAFGDIQPGDIYDQETPFRAVASKTREAVDRDGAERENAIGNVPQFIDEDVSITDNVLRSSVAQLGREANGRFYEQTRRLLWDPRASVADLFADDALLADSLITEEEAAEITIDGESTVRDGGGTVAIVREMRTLPNGGREEVDSAYHLHLHAISVRNDVTLFVAAEMAVRALAAMAPTSKVNMLARVLTARLQRLFPFILPSDAYGLAGDIDLEFYLRFWAKAAQSAFAGALPRAQIVSAHVEDEEGDEASKGSSSGDAGGKTSSSQRSSEKEGEEESYESSGGESSGDEDDEAERRAVEEHDVEMTDAPSIAPPTRPKQTEAEVSVPTEDLLRHVIPLLVTIRRAVSEGRTEDLELARAFVDACSFVLSPVFTEALRTANTLVLNPPLPPNSPPIFGVVREIRRWAVEHAGTVNWAQNRADALAWAAIFCMTMYSYARRVQIDNAVLDEVAESGGPAGWQRDRVPDAVGDNLDTLYAALFDKNATVDTIRAAAGRLAQALIKRIGTGAAKARQTPAI